MLPGQRRGGCSTRGPQQSPCPAAALSVLRREVHPLSPQRKERGRVQEVGAAAWNEVRAPAGLLLALAARLGQRPEPSGCKALHRDANYSPAPPRPARRHPLSAPCGRSGACGLLSTAGTGAQDPTSPRCSASVMLTGLDGTVASPVSTAPRGPSPLPLLFTHGTECSGEAAALTGTSRLRTGQTPSALRTARSCAQHCTRHLTQSPKDGSSSAASSADKHPGQPDFLSAPHLPSGAPAVSERSPSCCLPPGSSRLCWAVVLKHYITCEPPPPSTAGLGAGASGKGATVSVWGCGHSFRPPAISCYHTPPNPAPWVLSARGWRPSLREPGPCGCVLTVP